MPLFGPPPEIHATLQAVFVSPPDNDKPAQRAALKAVGTESDAIVRLLGQDEIPIVVAFSSTDADGITVIVVTSKRTMSIKNGRIRKQLSHHEVAETKMFATRDGRVLVEVESIASQQDYGPRDPRRFEKILMANVSTPRIANAICAAIDIIISRK